MTTVVSFLAMRCVGSNAVASGEVCEAAGLEKKNAPLISHLINAGFLPEYTCRPGRDGGVRRVDAPNEPKQRVDPEFVRLLVGTLALLVPPLGQGSVTRGDIAKEMGLPGGDTETKISQCLALNLCPGYSSQRGRGIFRLTVDEQQKDENEVCSSDGSSEDLSESSDVVIAETASEEVPASKLASTEAVAEVAVEEPKPKRSHKKKAAK